jgi:hypothetical protein
MVNPTTPKPVVSPEESIVGKPIPRKKIAQKSSTTVAVSGIPHLGASPEPGDKDIRSPEANAASSPQKVKGKIASNSEQDQGENQAYNKADKTTGLPEAIASLVNDFMGKEVTTPEFARHLLFNKKAGVMAAANDDDGDDDITLESGAKFLLEEHGLTAATVMNELSQSKLELLSRKNGHYLVFAQVPKAVAPDDKKLPQRSVVSSAASSDGADAKNSGATSSTSTIENQVLAYIADGAKRLLLDFYSGSMSATSVQVEDMKTKKTAAILFRKIFNTTSSQIVRTLQITEKTKQETAAALADPSPVKKKKKNKAARVPEINNNQKDSTGTKGGIQPPPDLPKKLQQTAAESPSNNKRKHNAVAPSDCSICSSSRSSSETSQNTSFAQKKIKTTTITSSGSNMNLQEPIMVGATEIADTITTLLTDVGINVSTQEIRNVLSAQGNESIDMESALLFLEDKGMSVEPHNDEPTNMHQILLNKKTSHFLLLVELEKASSNDDNDDSMEMMTSSDSSSNSIAVTSTYYHPLAFFANKREIVDSTTGDKVVGLKRHGVSKAYAFGVLAKAVIGQTMPKGLAGAWKISKKTNEGKVGQRFFKKPAIPFN